MKRHGIRWGRGEEFKGLVEKKFKDIQEAYQKLTAK